MSEKSLTDQDIPTLTVPTLKPDDGAESSANAVSIQAMKALFGVKLDKLKQDYEALEVQSEKTKQALILTAQETLQKTQSAHQAQIESLHHEFTRQIENVQSINRQQIAALNDDFQCERDQAQQDAKALIDQYEQQKLALIEALNGLKRRYSLLEEENTSLSHRLAVALSADRLDVDGVAPVEQALIRHIKQLSDKNSILEIELNFRNEQLALTKL